MQTVGIPIGIFIHASLYSSLYKSFRKVSTKVKCNLAQISKSPDENICNSKITLCSFLLDFSVPEGVGDKMVVTPIFGLHRFES